jgi:hypothetical protein
VERDVEQAIQVDVVHVESLRKELAQLRPDSKVQQQQRKNVRRVFEINPSTIVNAYRYPLSSLSYSEVTECEKLLPQVVNIR